MKLAIHLPSALAGAAALGLVLGLTSMMPLMQAGGRLRRVPQLTDEQQEILSHLSLVQLADGTGATVPTLRLSAADLQLVNGLGATNGFPADPMSLAPTATRTNGLGSLIVGYDEVAGVSPTPFRTGSHNLVLGQGHGYPSFGGLVGGRGNTVAAPYDSIASGEANGLQNALSAILGGRNNRGSFIGCIEAIGGGADHLADSPLSFLGGGQSSSALAEYTTVGGGLATIVPCVHDWAAGDLFEEQ